MSGQLVLIPTTGADWRLDDRTRETGRKGVAAAREVLRLADERNRRASAASAAGAGEAEAAGDAVPSRRKQPAA
jgi:hypothetical protein